MSDPINRLNTALEGRYRIEREIGEGGMATVYLADDLKHERKVALKVLKPELAAVVGAERFLAEIKTTANLQHPHILPLFDSGEAEELLFYVMPYVEGESLRDRLDREHQLPVADAVRIATNMAEALDYAHRHGVIHRDIKPANVLLQDGKPVISDFGIALAVGAAGGGRLTETGLSMGTPFYMSPEQAAADREPNAQSDVYSLGCVLYEMLVGDPPYTASSAQAVLAKILTADAPRARESRASIPHNVDGAIRKAIEKLPADRFNDALGFARALADPGFRYQVGVSGEGSGATRGSGPPWSVVLGMGVAIVLLAGGLVWTASQPGVRAASTGTSPVARFDLTSSLGTLSTGGSLALALSPDGRRLVYLAENDQGDRQLWLRTLESLEPEPIPGTIGGRTPALSRDGDVVAFSVDGSIHTVALPDGPPFIVGEGGHPTWGEDGALYFTRDQIIYRVNPGGGTAEPFTESVGFDQLLPNALPHGRGLLVTIRRSVASRSRIGVVGPEGGAVREILDGTQGRYVRSGHILYSTADGTLLAAPFDLETLEAGPAVPVVSGVRVEANSHTQFAVSESESLVYATAASAPELELVWVNRSGGVEAVDSSWVGSFAFPALSPDGSAVAVLLGGDVWVKRFAEGAPTRLTFERSGPIHPAWTPDGDSVLINPGAQLLTRHANGGGQPVATLTDERGVIAPNWSPSGEWLVYRTSINTAGGADIRGVRPGLDSAAVTLIGTEGGDLGPAISPDGRWLAYSSSASNQRGDVYVVPFPNVNDGKWLVSEGYAANPIWSRDGRELYYVRPGELVAVQVQTDPTFRILSSSVILTSDVALIGPGLDAQYDVAPDGRFLMRRRVGEVGASKVILIQNLSAELERLLPN